MISKFTYRPTLLSPYDFEKMEKWLEAQSEKGLHLSKFGQSFTRFKRGEPEKRTYKIDYFDEVSNEERLSFYADSGWHYASKLQGGTHILYAMKDEDFIPLHTDPMEESIQLKKIIGILNRRTLRLFLVFLVMVFLLIAIARDYNGLATFLVRNVRFNDVLFILYPLLLMISPLSNKSKVLKKIRELETGSRLEENGERWKRQRLINGITNVFLLLVIALMLILPSGNEIPHISRGSRLVANDEYYSKLPLLSMADLREPAEVETDFSSRQTLFARDHQAISYSTDEKEDELPEETLTSELYILELTALAGKLADEMMETDGLSSWREMDSEIPERLYIRSDGDGKELIAIHNNLVVNSYYRGARSEEELIDSFTEKFSSYNDN